jgi:hypothetical protein
MSEEITQAQAVFKDKEILLSRPEDMPFDVYKYLKKTQDKVIHKLFAKVPMYKQQRSRIKSKK